MRNNLFKNREDACNQLSNILPLNQMQQESWIVIATSSGGVPIAFNLANKLNAKFDFIFTQKIDASKNDECEIAIITETQEIIIHEELMKVFNIKLDNIYNEAKIKYNTDIKKYIKEYRDNKEIINMRNKNVLLVDEGLNTGLTMMACIKSAISCGAKSVAVAVPVLPKVTIADIESIADDLYYVKAPAHFVAIDFYYDELELIELERIKNIIKRDE
ncbi:MAG: ABC transporter [Arcobacteraceae bacterium]|nr:ABC transporter [Arcobacteraceae bacterium]